MAAGGVDLPRPPRRLAAVQAGRLHHRLDRAILLRRPRLRQPVGAMGCPGRCGAVGRCLSPVPLRTQSHSARAVLGDLAMTTLQHLLAGFSTALTLANLGWAFVGVTLGTLVGILPGIGPALTIALLLPVTSTLTPDAAFIMFAGLYYGAMYGSSTTSILLNTPGESGSIITAVEGNLMARGGRGAAALATAAIGSFVAGTIGTALLTVFAPWVVVLALKFGPADYFALMVVAFTTVSGLLGSSRLRGIISLMLGVAVGLVGTDTLTGQARFTLGIPNLLDGIDITLVAVSLFAVGEAFYVASRPDLRATEIIPITG